MRKLLIILAFLPLISWGQITPGYDFLYDGDIVVVGLDTTLEGDLNYILTNVDFDIALPYLPRKTKARLNDQPLRTWFQNANFADTLFALIAEHTINTDSTELLSARILEIWHYAAPTVDINNYAETPSAGTINVPDDYASITSAISAASVNDTIDVEDGTYFHASGLNITKAGIHLRAIGNCSLTSNAAQSRTVGLDADDLTLEGFYVVGGTNTYCVYVIVQDNCTVKNCYLDGSTSNMVYLRGSGVGTTNQITNSVLTSTTATRHIANQETFSIINECAFYGATDECVQDIFGDTGFRCDFTYNKSRATYTSARLIEFKFVDINIKFNDIVADSLIQLAFDFGITDVYLKTITLKGNNYDLESTSDASGFVNSTTRLNTTYIIDNNTVDINDKCAAINAVLNKDLTIVNNDITILQGNCVAAMLSDDATLTMDISNNTFNNIDSQNDTEFSVSIVENTPNDIRDFTLLFEGNLCRNGLYFGNSLGGHANLFIGNVPNSTIQRNYFQGSSIGGVIVKGFTGTSSGITSNTVLFDNIFDESGMFIKGIRGVQVLQNTIKNDTSGLTGIVCIREVSQEDSDSLVIKNNIISQESGYPLQFDAESFIGVESENNILYGNSDTTALVSTTVYDWSGWQGLGYDLNSFNTGPNFKSSTKLWPITPSDAFANGLNLGSDYKAGLDITSVWPDNVVLKNQINDWTIGAYVVIRPAISTFNNGFWIYNGGAVILK